jgi:hypothetical protein
MIRYPRFATIALLVAGLAGSSAASAQTAATQPAETPREVLRGFVAWTGQVGQALESAKDVPSAQAAAKQIEASVESGRKLFERSARMLAGPSSLADIQAIRQEFQADIEKNMARISVERQRIAANPALNAILSEKVNAAIAAVSRAATTAPASERRAE